MSVEAFERLHEGVKDTLADLPNCVDLNLAVWAVEHYSTIMEWIAANCDDAQKAALAQHMITTLKIDEAWLLGPEITEVP